MILDFSRSPPKDGSAPNCLAETDQPLFLAEPIEQVKLTRDVALGEGSDINLLREAQRELGVKGR
jgi:hypothetical protein